MTGRSKGQCKWGDRCFMNLQEQAVLFFTSLWMHAVFVSAEVTRASMRALTLQGTCSIRRRTLSAPAP